MIYIRKLDKITSNFIMFINKKGVHNTQSKLGGILTVLTYILITSVSIYFTQDFFKLTKPYVNMNEEQSTKDLNFNKLTEIPFAVRITDDTGHIFAEPERIYRPAFLWIRTEKVDGNIIQKYNPIPMSRCYMEKHINSKYSYLFKSINLESYFCIDYDKTQNYDLIGMYGSEEIYSFGGIGVFQCANTNEKTDCYSPEKIDTLLKVAYLEYFIVDSLVSSVTLDPIIPKINKNRLNISNSNWQRVWLGIRSGFYNSDFGVLFEHIQINQFHTVELYKEDVKVGNKEDIENGKSEIVIISIQNHSTITYYYRTFMKAQQLLANIGGIIKGLMVIAEILNFLLGGKLFYLSLSRLLTVKDIVPLSTNFSKINKIELVNSNLKFSGKVDNIEEQNKSEVKINNLTNNNKTPFNTHLQINNVKELMKRKINLKFYEKITSFACCKSNEIQRYNTVKEIIHNKLSIENLMKNLTSIEVMKEVLFNDSEKQLIDFLELNSGEMNNMNSTSIIKACEERNTNLPSYHELKLKEVMNKLLV